MDIDDQLQMLQRQLMEVQQQKTNPLSERTVAEIMIKLYQQGFKFFATTDGNEYITPDKLDNQIIQFVNQRGRTKIGILPQILNLNQDLIESRINLVCQKSTHIRNNDNLISAEYLRNFIHTLKQKLQIDGIVELDQISLSHQLNMPFLMKIVNENLNELDAQINGNQLVTRQYRRMKKRRILGFLLPISRPVNIQTLLKSVKLSQSNSQALIEQLISEGKLKGRCQSSFYIPDKFSQNQKQMIQKFFQTNGYIQYNMLQKNYMVSKPQEWIKKNLKGEYTIFEQACFNQSKLDSYKSQVQSLLKGQGFFQISNIVPFDLDDRKMEKFLNEICGVKDFVLDEGICYSEEWLSRCVDEFRDKVIYDIFFKKNQPKGKKKGGKKQKQSTLTEQELIQTLFDAGLAQYSVAQNIASSLMPLISQRFDGLKTKIQKQLTQSQGIINNAFLKYKKCKTIIKTPQNLQRTLNTIQKQKKKGGQWVDPDFGPNENNPDGKFSLIYYDGVPPKQWSSMQNIRWVNVPATQIVNNDTGKSRFMTKCLLADVLKIINHYNSTNKDKIVIQTPNFNKIPDKINQGQQPTSPFVFRFFIGEKQSRYVLIDNRMPMIEQEPLSSGGLYGLVEKAYAKLRYCYKGILGVGLGQIILQLSGNNPTKISIQNLKDQQRVVRQFVQGKICQKNLVIGIGQGVAGKNIKIEGENTQFKCMKPYQIINVENQQGLYKVYPGQLTLQAKLIPKLFKNIYLVESK